MPGLGPGKHTFHAFVCVHSGKIESWHLKKYHTGYSYSTLSGSDECWKDSEVSHTFYIVLTHVAPKHDPMNW